MYIKTIDNLFFNVSLRDHVIGDMRLHVVKYIWTYQYLIILDIAKPNLTIVLLYIEQKNGSHVLHVFCFFTDMITLINYAPHSYMT